MAIEKLTQVKIQKEQIPYTQISNKVIQHIKDPLAGFVYVYLLSMPPDWIVIKSQLIDALGIGEKKMKDIFSYFKRANLIAHTTERDAHGRIIGHSIVVLCGDLFNEQEPFKIEKNTTGAKNDPMVESQDSCGFAENPPQGQKTTGWRNHTGGKEGTTKETQLQRKQKAKKDFQSNKNQNLETRADVSNQSTSFGYQCETAEQAAKKAEEILLMYKK